MDAYSNYVSLLENLSAGTEWQEAIIKFLFDIRAMNVKKINNNNEVIFNNGIAKNDEHLKHFNEYKIKLTDGTYLVYFRNDNPDFLDYGIRFLHSLDALLNERDLLKEAATHDPLTNALNRKGLMDWFENRIKKYTDDLGFLLVMFDLDNFKELNDTHGHERGDDALKELVITLKKVLRSYDVVARLGGDEFVIILEMSVCHKGVRGRLESIMNSLPLKKYDLGLTMGAACYPDQGIDLQQLLTKADALMYKGKGNGKNQIVLWGDEI